jgi:hypothetical protein
VALLLAFAQLLQWLAVRRYFEGIATAVAPVATLGWAGIDAFPPGRLGLSGARFAVADDEALAIEAEHVAIHGEDPLELLLWSTGLREQAPEPLTLRLRGVRISQALLARLRPASGAGFVLPFEAFGCAATEAGMAVALTAADYEALGWATPRFDIDARIERDRNNRRLVVGMAVDRIPAGSLRIELAFADVDDAGIRWRADLGGARIERVTVAYEEQGALAARNAHCTAHAHGGDAAAFQAQHLERLHEWLRGHGLVPDEPVWAAYRRWLDTGGPIELVAEPAPGVPLAAYGEFAPEDRLRLLGVSARVAQGEPVPVEAMAVRRAGAPFRPLPPLTQLDPHEAFERSSAGDAGTDADPADPADPLDTPGDDAASAGDAAIAADPPATPPASAPAPTSATGSLPVVPAVEPQPVAIGFAELAVHLGRRVRVETVAGNRHQGIVLDATADAVELEIRRYGGGARLPIARDRIRSVELMPPAQP